MGVIKKIVNKILNTLKNNVFINSRWGKLLMLVLFVCLGIGIIIFSFSNHYLRKEMNTTNQSFVNTFANNMDSVLTHNNQSSYQITSNNKIMSFVSDSFSDSRDLIISSAEISDVLHDIMFGNYYLANILVYSSKNNRIADISSSASLVNYYNNHLKTSISYENFIELLNSDNTYTNFYLDGTQYIANIQKKRRLNYDYTIIMFMSPQKVFENFIYSDFSQSGIFAMLYKDNNAFMYYNGNIIYQNIGVDYTKYANHTEASKIKFDGNKYIVTSTPSSIDHFVFLFMDDYSRTASIVLVQLVLIVILMILSTLISGMYIYKYASANFKKIHEILYNIQPEIIPNSDLMIVLENQVSELLEHKNISEEKLASQNKIIIANRIERLLHSSVEDTSLLLEELNDLGIVWNNNCFIVLGFYILNYGEFEDINSQLFNNSYNMCQFVLQNIFEELISQKFTTVFAHSDNLPVFLINLPSESNSAVNSLISLLREGISVIADTFKFKYVLSLSEAGTGIENISLLYSHMLMNFENIVSDNESGTIYRYSENTSNNIKTSLSKEFNMVEAQIYNAIKAKDFDKAVEFVDQFNVLFNNIEKSNDIRVYLIKLSSTIASSLSTVIDDNSFNLILNDIVIMEKLVIPYKYLDKIKKLLLNIKNDYIADSDSQQIISDNNIAEKVNKYILSNISCANLSIPMICEYMNIPSRILSQEYKTQTGSTISKYIQTSRVELAKKLLLETNLSINEITERVGYDYALSFTRLFKKYESISPTE